MKIYLVRHGESESNAGGVRQGTLGDLTEKGKRQAGVLAARFKTIPLDGLVVSPAERTKQTAEIINQAVNKKLVLSDLFKERKNPTEFIGRPKDEPRVREITEQIHQHFSNPDWHYSDEENFSDLKQRSLGALGYLKSLPWENTLVVTHGVFIRALVAGAIFGRELTPDIYWRILFSWKVQNTGITVLESREPPADLAHQPEWSLSIWNDHAHLGEIL